MFFEDGDGFNVSAVRWETVTKVRGRVALTEDRQKGGTEKLIVEADLRDWEGMLMWKKSDRYGGARLWMAFIVWRRMLLYVFNFKPVQLV